MRQPLVEQSDLDAMLDEAREIIGVLGRHVDLRDFLAHRLVADRVEQQPRGDEAVRGILLDECARRQDDAFSHLVHRHAFVQILERRFQDALGLDVGESLAGALHQLLQPREIERPRHALLDDVDRSRRGVALGAFLLFVRALLRPLLAVEHVRARDLVLAAAHQRQLDLILDLFDVNRAALGLAAHQRGHDVIGELRGQLAHAGRRGALAAVDGEERLGHRDRDLRGLEADDRTIAADDLVLC